MPAEQGLWLEDDRCVDQGREQTVEADEDQSIYSLQPESGRGRPPQDDELLPQIKDLSFASGLRATHHANSATKNLRTRTIRFRSLPDWKAIDRLDKIFGSRSLFVATNDWAGSYAIIIERRLDSAPAVSVI
jgi:hypothetical protein